MSPSGGHIIHSSGKVAGSSVTRVCLMGMATHNGIFSKLLSQKCDFHVFSSQVC